MSPDTAPLLSALASESRGSAMAQLSLLRASGIFISDPGAEAKRDAIAKFPMQEN